MFPRPDETKDTGYSGKIKFATDGKMQMHLAERNLDIGFKHNEIINPVERGHIAFKTDNIQEFLLMLDRNNIPYSDYGTTFAKEWHQVFFHDPEGNIIEALSERFGNQRWCFRYERLGAIRAARICLSCRSRGCLDFYWIGDWCGG